MTNRLGKDEVHHYCAEMLREIDEEFNLIEEFNNASYGMKKILLMLLHETLHMRILSATNCDSDHLITDIISYFGEALVDKRKLH